MRRMAFRIIESLNKFLWYIAPEWRFGLDSRTMRYLLARHAIQASADYVYSHMKRAQELDTRQDLYDYVLPRIMKSGALLEFGVSAGKSIRYFARRVGTRTVHGFDSFEGFPDDGALPVGGSGAKFYVSKLTRGGNLPEVPSNVVLHKGWFTDTLPEFVAALREPVALLHIDCDIYSSTRDVFAALVGHLVQGTIIVFDEYYGFYGWERHEFLAFQEIVAAHGIEYEYIAYTYDQQAAVRILNNPAAAVTPVA